MYRNTAILAVPAGGRPHRLLFCGQDDRKPITAGTAVFLLFNAFDGTHIDDLRSQFRDKLHHAPIRLFLAEER